ncbi:MAG TPA: MFS transporter [Polyangiales bacterium]|nr:MFS transporter [Polyangiales bacterium]
MTSQSSAISASAGVHGAASEFQVTEGYRRYVVWLLFAVYVLNFVDRQILTILIQPIKLEFGFSDTQLGLLGGLAFALLYSILGIPIARRADRTERVTIISLALLVWSGATALTGLARTFTQLLLARLAVGVGEAGCSPPAYSLIADYFPPERRATAISIYSMGIYAGVFVGLVVGGEVAQSYGWRAAFYVVGLPGILLALVVKLTLREPPRGLSDPQALPVQMPPFREVLTGLWARQSFRHLSLAAALHSFVGYGVAGFYPTFMIRCHGMGVAEVGRWMALVTAIGGVVGTYWGGHLADGRARRSGDERQQVWVPALATLLSVPVSLLIYVVADKYAALALMFPAGVLGAMYLGPTFAVTLRLASVRERALAGAILLLIMNLIGLGLGPLLTGAASDLARGHFTQHGVALERATAEGLRWALALMTFVNVWSAWHYLRAARTLRADLVR